MGFMVPFFVAIFLALNMGGSGAAPAFSAAYGAQLIKRAYIPFMFGTFVLLGAIIAGDKVIKTIGGSVLPAEQMGSVVVTIVLLASALSIFFANLLKVPQSTSQSTVFALVGCAYALQVLESNKLLYEMIPTWFIMPLISFALTFLLCALLYRFVDKREDLEFRKIRHYPLWRYVTIACSCYVAFSIGSNNVANSAGPLAAMTANQLGVVDGELMIMFLSVILIAPWFGIGSSVLGRGVVKTIGHEIVKIGVMEAALVSVITATLLLLASTTRGIPTSLVQMNTFAVIAIGLLKVGPKEILSRVSIWKLFIVWVVAPVFALVISYVLTIFALQTGLLSQI